ncbi:NAD-dependent epimerase/dehydratase family protein [Micromonospora sp. NPDC050495]|uniref:NAD-dependent epimerase/dehydratase family protein n=1 Tax=Micromonospora sp. NPDC050495 TaxID=3154936 RepID=UPI00340A35F0
MGIEDFYRGRIVLVTGGAGAIGSVLARQLSDLGAARVIVLDDLSASFLWRIPDRRNVLFVPGSVVSDEDLHRVFSEGPSVVFHLAALFANQNSVDYPRRDLEVNGLGTLKVLQYSRLARIERFVFASSSCSVYGVNAEPPLSEDRVSISPTTPYQATKLLGELYCNYFSHEYSLPCVRLRLFSNYGPGDVPGQYRNVIPNFIYWAMKGEALPVNGDGSSSRDFVYVDDLARGLLLAGSVDEAVGQAFNLGSGRETRIIDLANAVNAAVGNTGGVRLIPQRSWDKRRMAADPTLSRRVLGFHAATDIEAGLARTVSWFRENLDLIESSSTFSPGISSAHRQR